MPFWKARRAFLSQRAWQARLLAQNKHEQRAALGTEHHIVAPILCVRKSTVLVLQATRESQIPPLSNKASIRKTALRTQSQTSGGLL